MRGMGTLQVECPEIKDWKELPGRIVYLQLQTRSRREHKAVHLKGLLSRHPVVVDRERIVSYIFFWFSDCLTRVLTVAAVIVQCMGCNSQRLLSREAVESAEKAPLHQQKQIRQQVFYPSFHRRICSYCLTGKPAILPSN